MTPAIKKAKQAKITFQVHEYEHDPKAEPTDWKRRKS